MKTETANPVAFKAGQIVGETEKAYKVEFEMHRQDGETKDFTAWMPKSRSYTEDGACWVTRENAWLIDRKYDELEGKIQAYRRPLGITAKLDDGEIANIF